MAEALLLRPLHDDPQAMEKFRREQLYAPLPGTKEAKVSAQAKALAAMGLSFEDVDRAMASRRAKAKTTDDG